MAEKPTHTKWRVFIASPGDVAAERSRLHRLKDDLNRTGGAADAAGVQLEMLDWHSVAPLMGRPEQVILDQLPLESWDLFIGILWLRFGMPTGAVDPRTGEDFRSGTEEEFKLAYRSWEKNKRPKVLFYRCKRPPENLDRIDPEQLKRVNDFIAGFNPVGQHPGLVQTFTDGEDFEHQVRRALEDSLRQYAAQHSPAPRETPVQLAAPLPSPAHEYAARRYLDHLVEVHRALPVAGFETNLRIPIPLEDVYVTLRARMSEIARWRGGPAGRGTLQAPAADGWVIVEEALRFALSRHYDGLVILGDPGSGKTTLTKFFVLCFASGKAKDRIGFSETYVPLIEALRKLKGFQARYLALRALQHLGERQAAKAEIRRALSDRNAQLADLAREILVAWGEVPKAMEPAPEERAKGAARSPARIFDEHELNAEYLLVPGGCYTFSQTEKPVDVPDLHFATYPVTNRRYRRFIGFLSGKNGAGGRHP